MLTHYTRTAEAVANILQNGFAWIPNRRHLASMLIPKHDFTRREPQQFGMISFTELDPDLSAQHCGKFGNFGIIVADRWAHARQIQRVIYVDEKGPLADALMALFDLGYQDITQRIEHPEDGTWGMAYENKVVASCIVGSVLWANLLQIWEYLEPESSADQREWRIVNPEPYYSLSENKAEAIEQVSPPLNWAKFANVIPISPSDVVGLVCRASEHDTLLSMIPANYRHTKIFHGYGA